MDTTDQLIHQEDRLCVESTGRQVLQYRSYQKSKSKLSLFLRLIRITYRNRHYSVSWIPTPFSDSHNMKYQMVSIYYYPSDFLLVQNLNNDMWTGWKTDKPTDEKKIRPKVESTKDHSLLIIRKTQCLSIENLYLPRTFSRLSWE